MKYITPFLLAATLAVAAPTNFTDPEPHLFPRMFQGSINWFSRYDCTNPCVEDGYCLSGQESEGDLGGEDSFIGWDSGCWDRPAGAHSVAVSVDNGHKFTAIDKSCKKFHEDGYVANEYQLPTEDAYGAGKCTEMAGTRWEAVYYDW
jgi:hypothetical protein